MCFDLSSLKFRFFATCLILIGLLQTGCDRFLKSAQSPRDSDVVQVQSVSEKCLSSWPENLKSFVNDRASDPQIDGLTTCLKAALTHFALYTKADNPDFYSADELQYFLNRYLLKDDQVTPELMAQIMKIKVVFVGGSSRSLSRAELQDLNRFLDFFGQKLQQLKGHIQVFFFRPGSTDLKAYQLTVQQVLRDLLRESHLAQSGYQFSDFQDLLGELQKLSPLEPGLNPFLKWNPLLVALKNLLVPDSHVLRSQKEWEALLSWGVDSYFWALRAQQLVHKTDWRQASSWESLVSRGDEFFALLKASPQFRLEKKFEANQLDQLLGQMKEVGLIPGVLDSEVLVKSYRAFVLRALKGVQGKNLEPASLESIEANDLAVLEVEFQKWRWIQNWILKTALEIEQKSFLLKNWREVLTRTPESQLRPDQNEAWTFWKDYLVFSRPSLLTPESTLQMNLQPEDSEVSISSLSLLNLFQVIQRFVFRAYAEPGKTTLSVQNLSQLEVDFRELGRKLKFLDPRSESPVERTFQEANFFTAHGNGDEALDPFEFVEELTHMVSGGGTHPKRWVKWLVENNCHLSEQDVFQYPLFQESCFEKGIKQELINFNASMPEFQNWYSSLSAGQKDVFFQNLLSVAKSDFTSPGKLEFAEIRVFMTVLQYVETLFLQYDTDRNQRLSERELRGAAPRFRQFIGKVSPLGSVLVDDVFVCLVYKGRKPGFSDLLLNCSQGREVGRQELFRVLSVLKNDLSKKR